MKFLIRALLLISFLAISLFIEFAIWAFIVGFRSMYEPSAIFTAVYWVGTVAINMLLATIFIALTSTINSSKKNKIVIISVVILLILLAILGYSIYIDLF